MADIRFSPARQTIYEAALARQRENEARQRAMAVNAAARAGVRTSGVSRLPQAEISREALRSEADIGAEMARAEEQERLQEKQFAQQKELAMMSLAEAARARRDERRARKAGIWSSLLGAGLGAAGNIFMPRD